MRRGPPCLSRPPARPGVAACPTCPCRLYSHVGAAIWFLFVETHQFALVEFISKQFCDRPSAMHLLELPQDILDTILRCLDLQTLLCFGCSCRQIHALSRCLLPSALDLQILVPLMQVVDADDVNTMYKQHHTARKALLEYVVCSRTGVRSRHLILFCAEYAAFGTKMCSTFPFACGGAWTATCCALSSACFTSWARRHTRPSCSVRFRR